jgi:hypothetical protein
MKKMLKQDFNPAGLEA